MEDDYYSPRYDRPSVRDSYRSEAHLRRPEDDRMSYYERERPRYDERAVAHRDSGKSLWDLKFFCFLFVLSTS